jgi:hypothetical protein
MYIPDLIQWFLPALERVLPVPLPALRAATLPMPLPQLQPRGEISSALERLLGDDGQWNPLQSFSQQILYQTNQPEVQAKQNKPSELSSQHLFPVC